MNTMAISNDSKRVKMRSFMLGDGPNTRPMLVWVELWPDHPKAVNSIWASLVNNTNEVLYLRGDEIGSIPVDGQHSRYDRFSSECPQLAGRVKLKFWRFISPVLRTITPGHDFGIIKWPNQTLGQTLAGMLETHTAIPILIPWGDYLLTRAISDRNAQPMRKAGPAPDGYWIKASTPWEQYIREGFANGYINQDGRTDKVLNGF